MLQTTDLKPDLIPTLLDPFYAPRRDPKTKRLEQQALIAYDEHEEEYRRTSAGESLANNLLQAYQMTWDGHAPGGGRWCVQGRHLHCGDVIEVMLGDGTWQKVRFEVAFTSEANAQRTGGRLPKLYVAIAGGGSLVCDFELERTLFRWPQPKRNGRRR